MASTRIMYIENKNGVNDLIGDARIGRVTFSKTGKSIHYNGRTFQTLSGTGFKANYFDVETGGNYWISGCHKDGNDRLYGERLPIYIDDDVREEYWLEIRNLPNNKDIKVINGK
ncbi:MAG: 1-deoxy-D-xylulose-5-phosphate synthase [Bacteroidetes bacterium]|nr:1-deoxy-D-xylulose-5-phosphate synthase [Bacteroidota bacterium]